MGKGNNARSNKETKKPKKVKPKFTATADSGTNKASTVVAAKKAK